MKSLLLALAVIGLAGAAAAQSKPAPGTMSNTAGVRTHLQTLHYKDVHDLRRGPDGNWTGMATQGNVPKTITVQPDGTVIAR